MSGKTNKIGKRCYKMNLTRELTPSHPYRVKRVKTQIPGPAADILQTISFLYCLSTLFLFVLFNDSVVLGCIMYAICMHKI